jgi:hypothetical protein
MNKVEEQRLGGEADVLRVKKDRDDVAAIWQNVSQTGKTYFNVTVTREIPAGSKLLMFPNGYKGDNPARPDFYAYFKDELDNRKSAPTAATSPKDDDEPPF